ncbi:MAG: T9SS type A sorting domain-containing protein [Bacteroidales bacterium]|nr:T9SS type A sorting domain-containing protein [Bacteroidales bacterium]
MKTKTTLKTLLIIIFFTVAAMQAKTQIVYTDLEPDIIIMDTIRQDDEHECYLLDLNNDSFTNFEVCIKYWWTFQFPENRYVQFFIDNSLNRVAVDENDIFKAKYLNLNDTINQQLVWPTISYGATICVKAFGGNYCPINEKYYGLRILQGTDTLYGWVRIHATLEQAIIKDYAYNATPGEALLAGQISLNTQNVQQNCINIFTQNKLLIIDFENTLIPSGTVKILNTIGGIVFIDHINSLYSEINLSNLVTGVYVVKVETGYGVYIKKIFLQ